MGNHSGKPNYRVSPPLPDWNGPDAPHLKHHLARSESEKNKARMPLIPIREKKIKKIKEA